MNEHVAIVIMLVLLGLSRHEHCPAAPGRHAGDPLGNGAVPASQVRRTPLHQIISRAWSRRPNPPRLRLPAFSTRATSTPGTSVPMSGWPTGSHVLLLDDTWAGGATHSPPCWPYAGRRDLQCPSRVAPLGQRRLSAATHSSCASCRVKDYAPDVCPWTGGICPDRSVSEV